MITRFFKSRGRSPWLHCSGLALLEVVIALALFVAVAVVVTSALNASLDSLDQQRRNTHAVDLASSILAEIQLGIRAPIANGAQPFEAPFADWTWETAVTPTDTDTGEGSGLNRIEVIVRHPPSGTVRRLVQMLRAPSVMASAASPVP